VFHFFSIAVLAVAVVSLLGLAALKIASRTHAAGPARMFAERLKPWFAGAFAASFVLFFVLGFLTSFAGLVNRGKVQGGSVGLNDRPAEPAR
jgi:hypothetical protein